MDDYLYFIHHDRLVPNPNTRAAVTAGLPGAAGSTCFACALPSALNASGTQPPSPPIPCNEAAWPDLDHDLVCGECKVLVHNFRSYGTCDGYCEALGRICCAKLGLGDGSEMLEPFELSLQSWLGLFFVPTYKRILKDKAKGVLKKTL